MKKLRKIAHHTKMVTLSYLSKSSAADTIVRKMDNVGKIMLGGIVLQLPFLLHNHPRGLPPSISDINALVKNKNVSGVTIGHDGSMYYYTRPNTVISQNEWDIVISHYEKYSETTSMEKALEILSKKYDFIIKKL